MITLAIVSKDVRRLWPQLLLFWSLLLLSALYDPGPDFNVVKLALPVACAAVVVAVIHQEALTGDRQYWLTRPIPRSNLAAAKAVFVVVCVNAALLFSHLAILAALGIPIGEHLTALFWRQLFLTAFLVLPAACLGAVTRSLGQAFLLVSLAAVLLGVLDHLTPPYQFVAPASAPPYHVLIALLTTAGAGAVLSLQYSRLPTRCAAIVIAFVTAIWFFAHTIQPPAPPRKVLVSLDPSPAAAIGPPAPLGALEIPIRIDGIPPGVDLTVDSLRGGIGLPDKTRRWMLHAPLAVIHDFAGGHGWLTVHGGQAEFLNVLTTPVNWYGSLQLVLSTRGRTFPLPGPRGLIVPGIGRCAAQDNSGDVTLSCLSPMPRTSLALELPNGARHWIVTQTQGGIPRVEFIDFRALQNFAGYTTFPVTELGGARLIQGDVVGRLEAEFYFQGIRLADYLPKHQ